MSPYSPKSRSFEGKEAKPLSNLSPKGRGSSPDDSEYFLIKE